MSGRAAMAGIEHLYPDTPALVAGVAAAFTQACRDAIARRGHAWLALAGGRTPLPVYAQLAQALRGARIDAVPTDERCVPHDHPACNLRQLRVAFPAALPLTAADGAIDASLAQARALLAAHPAPFDAVLLGMGADGHIASLFPGAANLADGLALDSGVDAIATLPDPLPPEAPFARISLTLPRLLRADGVHLVVTGHDKRAVLDQARRDPHAPFPVAALLHAGAPIHLHWSP
ncbi:6-phosphogluconolactonase [Thermomonas sp. S9]|uniref:6-phosphogluconolactonase n=1 Tax=Thermomonas sp. S9 TaxID=2885203 RepID=UPI00216B6020|nr:6-phosphogluconolactonase [Thermomonas sp. S9]MCR6496580.1 6-phosphogluconolactonase [Thermomonas sp. S9]